MKDREMMRLAAKAAGPNVISWSPTGGCYFIAHTVDGGDVRWAPLQDDGDALRLAVKLSMNIEITDDGAMAVVRIPGAKSAFVQEVPPACPFAATRRAIVRAAAELGKE